MLPVHRIMRPVVARSRTYTAPSQHRQITHSESGEDAGVLEVIFHAPSSSFTVVMQL
jgi:hypothetical protein